MSRGYYSDYDGEDYTETYEKLLITLWPDFRVRPYEMGFVAQLLNRVEQWGKRQRLAVGGEWDAPLEYVYSSGQLGFFPDDGNSDRNIWHYLTLRNMPGEPDLYPSPSHNNVPLPYVNLGWVLHTKVDDNE